MIDVDGDGRPDQAWLSAGRRSRVRHHDRVRRDVLDADRVRVARSPASAIVNRVQSDEIPIALVDLGREALRLLARRAAR